MSDPYVYVACWAPIVGGSSSHAARRPQEESGVVQGSHNCRSCSPASTAVIREDHAERTGSSGEAKKTDRVLLWGLVWDVQKGKAYYIYLVMDVPVHPPVYPSIAFMIVVTRMTCMTAKGPDFGVQNCCSCRG